MRFLIDENLSPRICAQLIANGHNSLHIRDYGMVEGTIHQAVAVCDICHARYRGLRKVHLQQVFSAVALNLIRLHTYWHDHPMDRARTSHLVRLELTLTA